MIFSDKKTAKEVRDKATKELHEFIFDIAMNVVKHGEDASEGVIKDYIEMEMNHDLPSLVGVMLYKSGIIHRNSSPNDENPHYPVTLFYDNDDENDYRVTQALNGAPDRLIGGLYKGRIHT